MGKPSQDHEHSDIHTRNVLRFGLWLAVSTAAVAALVALLMGRLARAYPSPATNARSLAPELSPPLPQLQRDPPADMARLRAIEAGLLSNPAWLDRNAGSVRIPIERAMELTLQRGIEPARPSQTVPSSGPSAPAATPATPR